MNNNDYAKLGRILQRTHPDIVNGVIKIMTPELKDTSAIAKMYESYCKIYDPKGDFNHKITFISSILNLYCPSALVLNSRVNGRVCTKLTEVMGYNHMQSISYYISQARVYIKNSNFKDNVDLVSTKLREVA